MLLCLRELRFESSAAAFETNESEKSGLRLPLLLAPAPPRRPARPAPGAVPLLLPQWYDVCGLTINVLLLLLLALPPPC